MLNPVEDADASGRVTRSLDNLHDMTSEIEYVTLPHGYHIHLRDGSSELDSQGRVRISGSERFCIQFSGIYRRMISVDDGGQSAYMIVMTMCYENDIDRSVTDQRDDTLQCLCNLEPGPRIHQSDLLLTDNKEHIGIE